MPTPKITNERVQILLELERRDKLPEQFKQELQMARRQGMAPPLKGDAAVDAPFKASEIFQSIKEAKDSIGFGANDVSGSLLGNIPGTSGRKLRAAITSIKANLAFDELAKMRANSPTGGALGSVSDAEQRLLAGAVADLDPGLDDKTLLDHFQKVERHYGNWLKSQGYGDDVIAKAMGITPQTYASIYGTQPPSDTPPPAGGQGGDGPQGGSMPPAGPQAGPQDPSAFDPARNPDTRVQLAGDGKPFSTDQDKAFAQATQALLNDPKTTRADFDALALQYGRPKFDSDLDQALKARANPNVRINVETPQSGGGPVPEFMGVTANDAKAFGAGLADAGSFGTVNKVKSLVDTTGAALSGDPRNFGDIYAGNLASNNLKSDLLADAHPKSALMGEAAGFLTGDAMLGQLGKAVPALGNLAGKVPAAGRLMARDATYGGLYGVGSSDSLAEVPLNVVGGAALAAAGGAAGRLGARTVANAIAPAVNPVLTRLSAAGISMTPGQIAGQIGGRLGNGIKGAEDWLSGIPGIGGSIKEARRVGTEDFNRAALNEVLAPIGHEAADIGHAGIADAQQKVLGARSDAISRMNLVPDEVLTNDLGGVIQNADRLSASHKGEFDKIIETDVMPYIQGKAQLSGDELAALDQGLQRQIANYRTGNVSPQDRNLADALENVHSAIMDNAARTSPEAAADFLASKKAYALLARVEGAAAKTNDGVFTPNQFKTAISKKGFGTGRGNLANGSAPFKQLSSDASMALPSSIPDSGTAGRNVVAGMLGMHGAGAALGGAGGYAEGGAGGAVAGTLAGAALGSALFSRPAIRATQKLLVGDRGKTATTLADFIRGNQRLVGALGTPAALDKITK